MEDPAYMQVEDALRNLYLERPRFYAVKTAPIAVAR